MDYLKLIIVDMSWQFAVLMACIVLALVVSGRIRAEQRRKREQDRYLHEQALAASRAKQIEHQKPVNQS